MKDVLQEIGFDEKEAEIYAILVKLDGASVTEIMKHTITERRSIYDVLERLVQKGRASFYEEQGRRVFNAIDPEVILEDLKEKQKKFEELIPKLKLPLTKTDAKVEILKGIPGLRSIFLDIIKEGKVHYVHGDISPLIYEEDYARVTVQFLASLKKKGLGEKVIYAKGDKITKIPNSEYKAIDKKFVLPVPTLIYGDVTTQYIYTRPITIIKITSKVVAKTNLEYFKVFWNMK